MACHCGSSFKGLVLYNAINICVKSVFRAIFFWGLANRKDFVTFGVKFSRGFVLYSLFQLNLLQKRKDVHHMIKANEHYNKLQASYLFADIARRVEEYQTANPEKEVIRLGIGDVTRARAPAIVDGFRNGVEEMAVDASFRGYGPEQGYAFLREAIAENDFKSRGAEVEADEIFVSDGAKCDCGNFQELFSTDIKIAIPDPVYPAYLDTNVMAGRTGVYKDGRYEGIVYLECTKENNFMPELPKEPVDLIYLCFPNNPTGAHGDPG